MYEFDLHCRHSLGIVNGLRPAGAAAENGRLPSPCGTDSVLEGRCGLRPWTGTICPGLFGTPFRRQRDTNPSIVCETVRIHGGSANKVFTVSLAATLLCVGRGLDTDVGICRRGRCRLRDNREVTPEPVDRTGPGGGGSIRLRHANIHRSDSPDS